MLGAIAACAKSAATLLPDFEPSIPGFGFRASGKQISVYTRKSRQSTMCIIEIICTVGYGLCVSETFSQEFLAREETDFAPSCSDLTGVGTGQRDFIAPYVSS